MALGVFITDGMVLFCHIISEENVNKKFSTREYNNSAVYEWLNNIFQDDCGIPALNLPTITIDDSVPAWSRVGCFVTFFLLWIQKKKKHTTMIRVKISTQELIFNYKQMDMKF